MSTPTEKPAAKAGGGKKKLLMLVVALASLGGGASVPMLMGSTPAEGEKEGTKKKHSEHPAANIPFGDVVVNLSEERMSRYLRIKIVLKCDGVHEEEEGIKLLAPNKPAMKSWLIGHLAGKSLKDVSGTVGVKRLQREILERFEEMMAPEEGHSSSKVHLHLKDVLFEEYVVQ